MRKLFCLEEYEEEAKLKIDKINWDYFSQGSCHGNTAKDNVEAYKRSVEYCVPLRILNKLIYIIVI